MLDLVLLCLQLPLLMLMLMLMLCCADAVLCCANAVLVLCCAVLAVSVRAWVRVCDRAKAERVAMFVLHGLVAHNCTAFANYVLVGRPPTRGSRPSWNWR